MIYLDNNATTEMLDEVRDAVAEALGQIWGNPSALHAQGRAARRALESARANVAALVAAGHEEVIFTSGGSEANALALQGMFMARRQSRPALVIGATEHPSVERAAQALASQHGAELRVAPVDADGALSIDRLSELIDERAGVVSVMAANNVTGVIADLAPVVALARRRGAWVHTDAIQAAGRRALSLKALGVDALSLSAHKHHGPKGVGALVLRAGVELVPLIQGGGQEGGLRAGTENVPAAIGFGVAAQIAARDLHRVASDLAAKRERLERGLRQSVPGLYVVAARAPRLPNTSCVVIPNVDGAALLAALDAAGLAASSGSACHSREGGPAPALLAMGLEPLDAQAALRLSLSRMTVDTDLDRAVKIIARAVDEAALGSAPLAAAAAMAEGD